MAVNSVIYRDIGMAQRFGVYTGMMAPNQSIRMVFKGLLLRIHHGTAPRSSFQGRNNRCCSCDLTVFSKKMSDLIVFTGAAVPIDGGVMA